MADPTSHPFLQGLSKHRGAPATVIVVFGASGDLTARKLLPAIYNLSYDNLLPPDFYLVGFAQTVGRGYGLIPTPQVAPGASTLEQMTQSAPETAALFLAGLVWRAGFYARRFRTKPSRWCAMTLAISEPGPNIPARVDGIIFQSLRKSWAGSKMWW